MAWNPRPCSRFHASLPANWAGLKCMRALGGSASSPSSERRATRQGSSPRWTDENRSRDSHSALARASSSVRPFPPLWSLRPSRTARRLPLP
jgi:hypothetical protein